MNSEIQLSQFIKIIALKPEAPRGTSQDSVTDGKGMGFGLYSTLLLVKNAGLRFDIRSGGHTLQLQNGKSIVIQSDPWQGTIVYLKLKTDKEINPSDVVANRTNAAEQYNETFLNDNELEELW